MDPVQVELTEFTDGDLKTELIRRSEERKKLRREHREYTIKAVKVMFGSLMNGNDTLDMLVPNHTKQATDLMQCSDSVRYNTINRGGQTQCVRCIVLDILEECPLSEKSDHALEEDEHFELVIKKTVIRDPLKGIE